MSCFDRVFRRQPSLTAEREAANPYFVDLRDESERNIERKSKSPLAGGDEQLARELCRLAGACREYSDSDQAYVRMRQIGTQINATGGKRKMQLVCYRVRALGGNSRSVESAWHRIGEWLG
jgi:hypothetical protein